MESELFYGGDYDRIGQSIKTFLNGQDDFLSTATVASTRATGDAIQGILADHFEKIVGTEVCAKYSARFARRAMADLAFEDYDGFYYVVDVKTHRIDTEFSMPNLTSVKRLSRFYEDDKNYFVVLMVDYEIDGLQVVVREVKFVPIEFLAWDCLTIGALGWGQIQIANAKRVTLAPGTSRRDWMLRLCDTLFEFYPREIAKIDRRLEHFRRIRQQWEQRES